jgi:hypothetical protein
MYRSASVFLGFVLAGVPLANVIAGGDPEPSMALLSLWMLGLLGSVVAAVTYQLSSSKFQRAPKFHVSLLAGVTSALGFFSTLLLIRHGVRLYVTIGLAYSVVVLVSGGWAMVGAKVALTIGSSDRGAQFR